ncbi:MAG: polysaccharide deacetylase family protein, partial [Oscillospiraceae bacterium]|nr:polysaccharide deacetylase family protein [Oscillospiraceae bacterium]
MFVLTLSKKRALRATLIILAVFIGIAVGVAAVFTSINTGAAETLLPIYSVDRPDNKISLTFDCAWGNSNTDELLAILEEHGVYATFFVTGEFVEKFP